MRNTYVVVLSKGLFEEINLFSEVCSFIYRHLCHIMAQWSQDVCVVAVFCFLFIPQLFGKAVVWKGLKPAPAPTADRLRVGHPQANDQPTGTSEITLIFWSITARSHCLSLPCSFQPGCRFETYIVQSMTALIHCIFSLNYCFVPSFQRYFHLLVSHITLYSFYLHMHVVWFPLWHRCRMYILVGSLLTSL